MTALRLLTSRWPRALGLGLFLFALSLSVAAPPADARPGGGQSFSGSKSSSSSSRGSGSGSSSRGSGSSSLGSGSGSSSRSSSPSRPSYSFPSSPSRSSSSSPSYISGSGTSSGDSSMAGFFFFLLLGGVALFVVFMLYNRSRDGWRQRDWDTAEDLRERYEREEEELEQERAANEANYHSVMEALAALKGRDQDFSLVLFEDFLYALYAEAQAARGGDRLERLSPYLSERARGSYAVTPAAEVKAIVVGSMSIEKVTTITEPAPRVVLTARFEANYTEVQGDGREQSYYVAERWSLWRSPDATSRPPDKARVFGCPSCGAPLDKVTGRACSYCKKTVDTGEFDWVVNDIEIQARETRGPMLTGSVEEMGTDLPTVVAPDMKQRYVALSQKDPALSWPAFSRRVEVIFSTFQLAWSSQEPMRVRPYLSDNLFQYQLYWVEAYQREGLKNITEDAKIATIQLARVVSDRYFDAITVRVFASSLDYTLNREGEVVSGSRSKERACSEYWTLIRGSLRTGAPRTDPVCPNCGAGLEINMTGHCAYCKAKVTSGEFDWVLSRIEQDEAYG